MVSAPILMAQLKEELKRRDMTIVEFSKVAGVSYNTAWRWLNNKSKPRYNTTVRACSKIGWLPDKLFIEDQLTINTSVSLAWARFKEIMKEDAASGSRALLCFISIFCDTLNKRGYIFDYTFNNSAPGVNVDIKIYNKDKPLSVVLVVKNGLLESRIIYETTENIIVFTDSYAQIFANKLNSILNLKHGLR